jgi:outer membrane protein assembly factor BamD
MNSFSFNPFSIILLRLPSTISWIKGLSVLWVIVLVMITAGCGGHDVVEKPVEVLLEEGNQAFDDGQYRLAIENFEQLRDWYPFSKHAILAELRIADAHYNLAEYPEAILAYEQFEQLHPRNESIPYVIYQIGRCYFDQVTTIDRDQTAAKNALEAFERLQKQHPGSDYALQASVPIVKCQQSLSAHEFYVGMFYYRSKHYNAALKRFEAVITQYPDFGTHQKALHYIANCEALMKVQEARLAN